MIRKEVIGENGGELSEIYKILHLLFLNIFKAACLDAADISSLYPTDAPVYLSSQSYMADSSLSEEMSQFDFSTGVQSFSYNSQNPSGDSRSSRTRVRCWRVAFYSMEKWLVFELIDCDVCQLYVRDKIQSADCN